MPEQLDLFRSPEDVVNDALERASADPEQLQLRFTAHDNDHVRDSEPDPQALEEISREEHEIRRHHTVSRYIDPRNKQWNVYAQMFDRLPKQKQGGLLFLKTPKAFLTALTALYIEYSRAGIIEVPPSPDPRNVNKR